MPIRSVVQNDRRRPKGHQQVELGREYDGPDALQYSLHNRVQVPGRDHARPQHAVGHIQAVRLESPHLDLMILHHLHPQERVVFPENAILKEATFPGEVRTRFLFRVKAAGMTWDTGVHRFSLEKIKLRPRQGTKSSFQTERNKS